MSSPTGVIDETLVLEIVKSRVGAVALPIGTSDGVLSGHLEDLKLTDSSTTSALKAKDVEEKARLIMEAWGGTSAVERAD
ncbi:hypothetical protein FRB93_012683 [Tulasnella sp. JGI-2019a]|nr:hypothetical protein FRB93_012683 [Tulasnella sp. JGI-2019a]